MTTVIGVWAAAGSSLLAEVRAGVPLLQLTLRRVKVAALPFNALVPWKSELDHLAADIKRWDFQVRRTHTDERIAMRDLVAELNADTGILVRGEAAALDRAEIDLARARLSHGFEEYISPRITAYAAQRWLKISDSSEWPDIMGQKTAMHFYHGQDLNAPARAIAARSEERPRND